MKADFFERTLETDHPALFTSAREEIIDNLYEWLKKMSADQNLTTLLAFLDDGLVWGKNVAGNWLLSSSLGKFSPQLRKETLQEIRLFGSSKECFLYRVREGEYLVRSIEDCSPEKATYTESFDELQFLWGTNAEVCENGFSVLTEGAQGLVHAIPVPVTLKDDKGQHPRLRIRHYLNPAKEPLAQVIASRCVGLELEEDEKNG